LDNELLGQIYLAYYLDMPTEAKNQKFRVFDDKYDAIFDEKEIGAEKMLVPYNVYLPLGAQKQEIQKKKRKKQMITKREVFTAFATFHILNGVKLLVEKEGFDLTKQDQVEQAISLCTDYIEEVVEKEKRSKGNLYSHDKFFKEVSTNK